MAYKSVTHEVKTNCGTLYVTIARTKEGKLYRINTHFGKNGECLFTLFDSLSYFVRLLHNLDTPTSKIIKGLKDYSCHNNGAECKSCLDAFGRLLEKELA
jgi:hypothetical protein